jgi:hypothetical protein
MKNILKMTIIAIILIAIFVSGCTQKSPEEAPKGTPQVTETPQPKMETFTGETRNIGNGSATSFIEVTDGKISSIGVTFSEYILQNLSDKETEYVLNLPPTNLMDGKLPETVFNHITIDWNPKGHIPPGIYDKPHFDFHFYLISLDDREKITGTGDSAAKMQTNVSTDFIPKGYVPTPGGEPKMGAHWIDPTSPEFNNQTFTKTFIYGFYNGTMVFLEPMITVAYLKTEPNLLEDIKIPEKYPMPGDYPIKYSLNYDEQKKEYTLALEEMMSRS